MRSLLARLVTMNDGWAKPFGDFNHRWVSALFRPIRPIKDFLNGTWLAHPVHPAANIRRVGRHRHRHLDVPAVPANRPAPAARAVKAKDVSGAGTRSAKFSRPSR